MNGGGRRQKRTVTSRDEDETKTMTMHDDETMTMTMQDEAIYNTDTGMNHSDTPSVKEGYMNSGNTTASSSSIRKRKKKKKEKEKEKEINIKNNILV